MVRLRAIVRETPSGWLATCVDIEAGGEGKTREEALASLRASIAEREAPEAVALPRDACPPQTEIVIVEDDSPSQKAHEPTGPGDCGPRLRDIAAEPSSAGQGKDARAPRLWRA